MKCQIADCPHTATNTITWRTPIMDASAYWYQCHDCTLETAKQFNHRPDMAWSITPELSWTLGRHRA